MTPPDLPLPAPDRVLLVDDNLDNLQVLYQALEEEGYELLLSQSGQEALEIAREATPALILLDINMPEMDGYETCRRLKADPQMARAVVVFLSARGGLDDKLQGFECGAIDYIEKPFQFEEVTARVKSHLATYRRERELEQAAAQPRGPGFHEFTQADLAELIASGESDKVEFKSTLRHNLRARKHDKKIENASLKTIAAYLNSDGGILLVGVDDDGQVLGLEPDQFANEDKLLLQITTLVRNHLGGEFSRLVRYTAHVIDGKSVLAVECLPSPEPVYFRRDQVEIFYIRSGPSSQKLSPSEIVAYVRARDV